MGDNLQVFNFKLGCISVMHVLNCVDEWPHLELKTRTCLVVPAKVCPCRNEGQFELKVVNSVFVMLPLFDHIKHA